MIRPVLQHLVFAGAVNGVVKGRPTAILQSLHTRLKAACTLSVKSWLISLRVESHHKRLVEARANHVLQETDGCFLFKVESAVHRSTDINQQSHFDGQVGFAAEIQDALRRFVVVKNAKSF